MDLMKTKVKIKNERITIIVINYLSDNAFDSLVLSTNCFNSITDIKLLNDSTNSIMIIDSLLQSFIIKNIPFILIR